MNMWWALRREKELEESLSSTNQLISEIETILKEYQKSPKELTSKIRESIKKYRTKN